MSDKSVSYSKSEKNWYVPVIMLASSFLMYVLAVLPIFIKRGLPFFYYGDYNVQQIPFYIVAHRAVRSGEFFWNWNVDLGGTMAGDFSFYLWGSPFFWITTLFPENAIPYLMPFLMALKYGCCACCAYLYIKRYVKKYTYAMIGGYLYAFSGFNACNIVFNHFTDAVAFFPLFLIAFENLMSVDDGKRKTKFVPAGKKLIVFSVMTAVMAIINYYFFFGQVIFLILYFAIRYARNNNLTNNLRMFNRALFGGVLGIFIAGFFVMQAFAGIKGNSRLENVINGYNMLIYPSEKLLWDIVKSVSMLPDIIGKGTLFYTGTVKNASLAAYLPMFGMSGVIAYFLLNRKKKNWEKSILVSCFVIAFIPVLNSAFSMFNSSYYARWFYMPILIMSLMTAQALERGKTPQLKKGAIAAALMFLFFLLVYFLPSTDESGDLVFLEMTENNTIFLRDVLGTGILCIMLLLLVFVLPRNFGFSLIEGDKRPRAKTGLRDVIFLFSVIVACIIATFVPIRNGSGIISERGKKMWQEQMLANKVSVDQSIFCRGEVDSTSTNYDMVWGIPSIHCFLSTVPSEIFDFLKGSCGITRTVETNLPTSRAGARAILSGKYFFENAEISKTRAYANNEGTQGYFFLKNENGFDVFENLNFIPMGFTFDYYITESEWEDLNAEEHDYELVKVLIIPDEAADRLGDKLMMEELTAEDILDNGTNYLEFTMECEKRAATACTAFETDTNGFFAKTSMLRDNTLVFFSVPATEGFSCTVDGKNTEIIKADYGLMAIPVSGGVHEIRVDYKPEGLLTGVCMSVIGIIVAVGYLILTKRLKNINKND